MFGQFTRDDKMMIGFAVQEASDLSHNHLGNDHLILGMLCNARSPLFALLGEQGLTLAGARDVVREFHAQQDSEESEAADDQAAEETAQQRYDEDREALRGIGIDLDKLRSAVRDRFGEDLSEGWGEREPRGRGRRRGSDGSGPDGCGPRGRGRGRRGHHGHGHEARGGFGPGGPGFGSGPGGFGPRGFGQGGPFGPGFDDEAGNPWEAGRGRRGPRGRGSRPRFAKETREAFGKAVEIARERGDRSLRAEYLLLGIIDTADAASRAVIDSATNADDLKAAVLASLPEVEAGV
ncbi:Clp protease N-terminal domain-containing protein [Gordonia sp. ABSL49_1]|uniref:Clp protease N-terminal domain-containing protein n=1 Tax=unclassified Gordonia (in: high G+C Gram-positive bacteria) TaxID=2657482 RepID=UPI001F0FE378|nr:Clp protease N-terminal domain-containing protein [Gordonia sp. ABSL49_1]MCH5643950.1 ATP-dependent Clp protease ATP-binding subunit [Gordonia sp. ABSL49_1]